MSKVLVIVPTFREKEKILGLLRSFERVRGLDLRILIINGNPGDATTSALRQLNDRRVTELSGHPGLYWSGLVNLGLTYVLHQESCCDFIIITNADVEFDVDALSPLVEKAGMTPNAQLASVTLSGQHVVSSGVKVASWVLTLNRHPLAGTLAANLPADTLIPVDFLPTRCTLIPCPAVVKAGLVAERQLPHYGGDYEYTNRLRRLGFQPYIYTGSQVRVDAKHTGTDAFHRPLSLSKRFSSLLSIKSTANPIIRVRFIRLAYPPYAWPSAMLLYLLRSLSEVLLGGAHIRSALPLKERGYSGS
jgi:GT2 family glycosyltransferase